MVVCLYYFYLLILKVIIILFFFLNIFKFGLRSLEFLMICRLFVDLLYVLEIKFIVFFGV